MKKVAARQVVLLEHVLAGREIVDLDGTAVLRRQDKEPIAEDAGIEVAHTDIVGAEVAAVAVRIRPPGLTIEEPRLRIGGIEQHQRRIVVAAGPIHAGLMGHPDRLGIPRKTKCGLESEIALAGVIALRPAQRKVLAALRDECVTGSGCLPLDTDQQFVPRVFDQRGVVGTRHHLARKRYLGRIGRLWGNGYAELGKPLEDIAVRLCDRCLSAKPAPASRFDRAGDDGHSGADRLGQRLEEEFRQHGFFAGIVKIAADMRELQPAVQLPHFRQCKFRHTRLAIDESVNLPCHAAIGEVVVQRATFCIDAEARGTHALIADEDGDIILEVDAQGDVVDAVAGVTTARALEDEGIGKAGREDRHGTVAAAIEDREAVGIVPGEVRCHRAGEGQLAIDGVDGLHADITLDIGRNIAAGRREARIASRAFGNLGAACLVDDAVAAFIDLDDAAAGRRIDALFGLFGSEILDDDLGQAGGLDADVGAAAALVGIDLAAAVMADDGPGDMQRTSLERADDDIALTRHAAPVIGDDGAGVVGKGVDAERRAGAGQQRVEALALETHRAVEGDHQIGGIALGEAAALPVDGEGLAGGDGFGAGGDRGLGAEPRNAAGCGRIAAGRECIDGRHEKRQCQSNGCNRDTLNHLLPPRMLVWGISVAKHGCELNPHIPEIVNGAGFPGTLLRCD